MRFARTGFGNHALHNRHCKPKVINTSYTLLPQHVETQNSTVKPAVRRRSVFPEIGFELMTKKALITGVTGQDGSYLAEFLLQKGCEVHGIKRRSSLFNTQRIDHIYEDPHVDSARFKLHYGDLTDTSNLTRILSEVHPDEVYNLGAQSHVAVSFEAPEYTADVDGIGTLRLLEAIRFLGLAGKRAFIKPLHLSSMGWYKRRPSVKQHRFIRAHPTQLRSFIPTGSRSIAVKHMAYMPVTVSSLITKARVVGKPLSHAKSPAAWLISPKVWSHAFTWAILTLSAIGATPRTTCACSG